MWQTELLNGRRPMAGAALSAGVNRLLEEPVIAHFATTDPSGRPHVTPVWVDHDGEHVLVNTAQGRAKERHVRTNPMVAISLTARDDPYRVLVMRGRVAEVTEDGADAHIDKLANKYLGAERYPWRAEGEVRLILRIRPERIYQQPAD
jgi:PPOX class probable F420-dependent enzyme